MPRCCARRIAAISAVGAAILLSGSARAAAGRPVAFQAGDGITLAGMFYEASARPAPAVVLVHMLGRSKDEWIATAERLQDNGISALAIDLRGHGHSAGNGSELPLMVGDVHAAIRWLSTRTSVRANALGLAGASLGATLAAMVAAEEPLVRAVALISPSLDYRGLRLDPVLFKKMADRAIWMAASTADPYALRTVKELAGDDLAVEQRLSGVRAHGTALLRGDSDLARALVDWLRARLIS